MKKLLFLILSLSLTVTAFTSCGLFTPESSTPDSSVSAPTSDEEKTYTVTFRQPGQEDVVIEVQEGGSISEAEKPVPKDKTGYTVTWKDATLTNIKGDIIVEAKETPNTYTITYDADGGEVAMKTQQALFDSDITLLEPTRSGYDFNGWVDAEGKTVTSGKWTIASSVTLKATWSPVVVTKYEVLFTQEGQEPQPFKVEAGTAFTDTYSLPNYAEKLGYTVKWDETKLALLDNVTANITVEAIETPNTYILTYNAGEGTASKPSQTVIFDSAIGEMATATRGGYIFKGWFNGQTEVTAKTVWKVADNVTLTAKWEAEPAPDPVYVTVTFKNGLTDTVIATYEVEKDTALESAKVPEIPSVDGYTFAWDKDTSAVFTEDTTITAVETANTYTLTYNAGEGTASKPSQTVTFNSAIGEMATATRDGYEFAGWLYNGKTVTATTVWTVADNAELTANWTKVTKYYTVVFNQNGQTQKSFEIEEGTAFTDKYTLPSYVEKTGYTVKWDEAKLALLDNVTANVTVDAIETANKYEITYQDIKGKITGKVTLEYDDSYDLTPTAVVEGYTFDKFTYNGKKVDTKGTWTIAENVTLVVNWTANKYTVSLDAKGGSCSTASMEIVYDSEYALPTPTRSGYTFTGWETEDGTAIALSGDAWKHTGANNSIHLKATWEKNTDDSSDGDWTKNY